jgi:hypothetical protein
VSPRSIRHLLAAGGLLWISSGCAERLQLGHDAPGAFWTGRMFWPPPSATSVWVGGPTRVAGSSLIDLAARVSGRLAEAGYVDGRVLPIGLDYAHGFAIATRLEKVATGGPPWPGDARWSPSYPEPPELRWLAFASEPMMPSQGRYRTLLVCFSDLPFEAGGRPPVENEWTVMDGPDVPRDAAPPARRSDPRYRLSLHVYEYEAQSASTRSRMLEEAHASEPAVATAARLGLGSV